MQKSQDSFIEDTRVYTSKHKFAWLVWTVLVVFLLVCVFAFIGSMTLEELPMNAA